MTNKFVSFLEKAGEVILTTAASYEGFGSIIQALLPSAKAKTVVATLGSDIVSVAGVVTNIEATFAAVTSAPTGTLKLQAAVPQVAAIVQAALGFTKDAIQNPALYQQGVKEITQGVVDILNSVKASSVTTTNSPVIATAPSLTVPAVLVASKQTITNVSK